MNKLHHINSAFIVNHSKISIAILCLALFLSQFYTWSSGLPQISHILILLMLFHYLFAYRFINLTKLFYLNVFVSYLLLVNITWLVVSSFDISYIWSSIYWLFNYCLLAIIVNIKNTELMKGLILKTILLAFIVTLLIYFLGLGRYNFPPRYNGYFNDPNQMAFWVICCGCIYLHISSNRTLNFSILTMTAFLILITLSRSALLSLPFIVLATILKQKGSYRNRFLLIILFIIIVFVSIGFAFTQGYFEDIVSRLLYGLSERESQEESRGFNIPFENIELTILGAGQGRYWLYSLTNNEIHSTWLGIFFYYGIIGLSIFLAFLFQVSKRLGFADKLLFIAPMIYGITTYNARNIIFWLLIGMFIVFNKNYKYKIYTK